MNNFDEQQPQFSDNRKPLRVIHDRKPTVDIIAGRQPVMEALRAGTLLEKVVILYGVKGDQIDKIKAMAKRNGIPVVEVGKQKFRDLVSDTTTQGVVAIIGSKKYVEVEDILKVAKDRNEAPFILILDEIQDPQNLGALIRTAECSGMHGVVIDRKSTRLNSSHIQKSRMPSSA